MDVFDWHAQSVAAFADLVDLVGNRQWGLPTPDAGWDVRELVNHVVVEDLWCVPLVAGATIAEVGDQFEGDHVGATPSVATRDAAEKAVAAFADPAARERTVQLSFGDVPAAEYAWQLTAEHLIHGWDLARAIGVEDRMHPGLRDAVAEWFAGAEGSYRQAGLIASRPDVGGGDPQRQLLAAFGRRADWDPVLAAVDRFNQAFATGEPDTIIRWMTADAVFESTEPPPDGRRYEGAAAVRQAWRDLFSATRDARFVQEEQFAVGDRAVVRWRFHWTNADGSRGHVRGVDVLRVRDGLVAEKLSYVKG